MNNNQHHIKPMLTTLTRDPFDKPGWIFELKWDGYRCIAEVDRGKVELYSRNFNSFNKLFAPIAQGLGKLKHRVVLDGEVVILDKQGKSHFQLLQNYQNTGKGRLLYYVFDILFLNGHDLRSLPLLERKKLLKQLLAGFAPNMKYSKHTEEDGIKFFQEAQKLGLEGIIAKDGNSPYRSGVRSTDWLKIKTSQRQEAVIGGFTEPRGSRKKFGALVLGVYEGDKFIYIGHTGGGFNDQSLKDVYNKLNPLVTSQSPFKVQPKTNAPVKWVKPRLVCEVSFSEWTGDGHMRQPIFQGLRLDKKPSEVIKEKPVLTTTIMEQKQKTKEQELLIGKTRVKVTNLDKVFWPKEKYTKADLIDYYRKISKFILPYLKDRPQSLNRHPNGINKDSFFQKDVGETMPPWVKTAKVFSESNNAYINYMMIQDEASLAYAANLGCIEINPWFSRIKNLDKPDYLVLDLDPLDISFKHVVETALAVKKVLDLAGIKSYCKTSGATGLHIYVPLAAKYSYEHAKQFAQIVAILTNKLLPKITSVERMPVKRKKKVYIDYLQNRRGQTLAAPYSVRPKPGAPVATPLKWSEVRTGLDPQKFNIKTIFERIKKHGDLFEPVLDKGADLKKALKKLS